MRNNSSSWSSSDTLAVESSKESLTAMSSFYSRFPYPGRPYWVKPRIEGMLQAHAGLARILVNQPCSVLIERLASGKPKDTHSWETWLKELDRHFSGGSIALVGCGTDEPLLFAMLHKSTRIDAYDVSLKSINIAKRKISFYKYMLRTNDIHFYHGDATEKLTQVNNMYDFIQCFGVLHHQLNPNSMLESIAKNLKDGGMLRLMTYTKGGRKAERWFQKKVTSSKGRFKLFAFIKVYLWMLWIRIMRVSPWYNRFGYLTLWPRFIADALAHPSDPGLSLKKTYEMLITNKFSILKIESKHFEKGWQQIFRPTLETINELAKEEEAGHIVSNILIFAQKKGESE